MISRFSNLIMTIMKGSMTKIKNGKRILISGRISTIMETKIILKAAMRMFKLKVRFSPNKSLPQTSIIVSSSKKMKANCNCSPLVN